VQGSEISINPVGKIAKKKKQSEVFLLIRHSKYTVQCCQNTLLKAAFSAIFLTESSMHPIIIEEDLYIFILNKSLKTILNKKLFHEN